MKTDHFAEFRRLNAEIAGTKGNGVTSTEDNRETKSFFSGSPVTCPCEHQVTRVTKPSPDSDVTHVTQAVRARVTERDPQRAKDNQENPESVTRVTRVTHKNSGNRRGRLSPDTPFDDRPPITTKVSAQEAEIDRLAAADGVMLLADAIASAPRAPFENDLAMAKAARFAVTTSRLSHELTGARLGEAQALCADTARAAADHIRRRDYLGAYELLDELPAKLRALIPQ